MNSPADTLNRQNKYVELNPQEYRAKLVRVWNDGPDLCSGCVLRYSNIEPACWACRRDRKKGRAYIYEVLTVYTVADPSM